MALIQASYVDELNEHAIEYLPEIVGENTTLKKVGKELVGLCVFHQEKSPSFNISPSKGSYYCHGCQAGGSNPLSFIIDYYRLPFPDAVKRLASITKFRAVEYETDNSTSAPNYSNGAKIKSALAHANRFYVSSLESSQSTAIYLRSRGITPSDVSRFGIGFAPDSFDFIPKKLIKTVGVQSLKDAGLASFREGNNRVWDFFRNRLMFPVRDVSGNIIAFGGRTLIADPIKAKGAGKYINSPESSIFVKGKHLYGLYESLQERNPETNVINVVEGYMDVVATHRNGFVNTVAPMGTAITQEQLQKLFKYSDHVRFVFDGDSAGYRAAYKASKIALSMIDGRKLVSVAILPKGEDPDSYLMKEDGRNHFSRILENSIPVSQFLIDYIRHATGSSSPESKTQLVHRAREIMDETLDPIYKELLRVELESSLSLPLGHLLPSIETDPNVWFHRLEAEEKKLLRLASNDVVEYCGLVLSEPEWLKLFPFSNEDEESSPDHEIIKFVSYTVEECRRTGSLPEKMYNTSLSSLVHHLKARSAKGGLEAKLLIAKTYGLRDDISSSRKKSVQSMTHGN